MKQTPQKEPTMLILLLFLFLTHYNCRHLLAQDSTLTPPWPWPPSPSPFSPQPPPSGSKYPPRSPPWPPPPSRWLPPSLSAADEWGRPCRKWAAAKTSSFAAERPCHWTLKAPFWCARETMILKTCFSPLLLPDGMVSPLTESCFVGWICVDGFY